MNQKFSMQQYISIQNYETHKEKLEESLMIYFKILIEQQNYFIKTKPVIHIPGYVKVTDSGFMPTNKESADFVDIFIFAEAIEKELE